MRRFAADLHVHTALSPCASKGMTPARIVERSLKAGLEMIAICDHNSARNVPAVLRAAGGRIAVIAGMEVTTAEEVHVVLLFADAASAMRASEAVRRTLPEARPPRSADERQVVFGEDGRESGVESRMLAAASGYSIAEAVRLCAGEGGLSIAAHVNRPSFGVLSQLGLYPEDARFDAVEWFAPAGRRATACAAPAGAAVVSSSDAHFEGEIGRCRTWVTAEEAAFPELARALRGEEGRRVDVA